MTPAAAFKPRTNRWLRLTLIILGGLTACCAAALAGLLAILRGLPPIEQLERYQPKQVTRIFDRGGRIQVGKFVEENRELVALDRGLPSYLPDAFVAIEDERFYRHFGIDLKAIVRAALVNLREGRFAQGFSTITLQLPRNILPEKISREKTLTRKIKECLLALQIERRYSKQQILEFYINQCYLGSGCYGVQAAARFYFDKDVAKLTLPECATLAGLPQKPSVYDPWVNPQLALKRRDQVLRKMFELKMIARRDYDQARAAPLGLRRPESQQRAAPYFVSYVRAELLAEPGFNSTMLNEAGLMIQTTLDAALQQIVNEELPRGLRGAEQLWRRQRKKILEGRLNARPGSSFQPGQLVAGRILSVAESAFGDEAERELWLLAGGYQGLIQLPPVPPYHDPDGVLRPGEVLEAQLLRVDHAEKTFAGVPADQQRLQGAAVVLDARSGEILALSGGDDFFDRAHHGEWNRAVQAARQPGSCFKPLIYAVALESGKYTLAGILRDEPLVYPGGYAPRNYDNRFLGPVTLQEALEQSRNVPTVRLFEQLGVAPALEAARNFDLIPETRDWLLRPEIPTCLGNTNINLLELAAAYLPFSNGGVGVRPRAVLNVKDAFAVPVQDFRPRESRVISQATAGLITAALINAVRAGTGQPVHELLKSIPDFPELAGKTGTTNDCVDAWFIGYTPQLICGVFVGFDQPVSMGEQMTGGRVAGPIFAAILRRIAEEQPQWISRKKFDAPDNIVYCDVQRRTGRLATAQTPAAERLNRVAFIRGTEPLQ